MNRVTLLKELQLSSYIALDLETTGLDPRTCAITEVSAYRFVDGYPFEEYSTLIDPQMIIPKEISELTGITDRMVSGKPKINEILSELFKFIGNDPIVGQNITFDISFINHACESCRRKMPKFTIYDTLTLAKTFLYF